MSLPAPAVPCLLPSSPQPSHAHTHPLQIFFPFRNYSEITAKQSHLRQNPLFRAFPETRSTPRKSHAPEHHSREEQHAPTHKPKPPQSSHTSLSPIPTTLFPPGAKPPFQNTLSFFFNSKLIHVPPCLRRALPAAFQPSTLSRPYPPLANIFPLRNYSEITAKQSHLRQNPLFRAFPKRDRLRENLTPQSIIPEKSNTPRLTNQNRPNPATLHFRQSRPLFFPREQNHLFKIPFLSFSIPSSSMSLPAPAVPCLLPTSPQPSHAHTHPLQIFFPFEITQKLLQNKAISVKILFFQHTPMPNTPIPKHSTIPPKHPQTYTSLKPLLKAFHLHSPHNPPSSSVLSSQSCNPAILANFTILFRTHPHNPAILANLTTLQSCNPHQFILLTILTLHPTILHPHNLTTLQSSPFILTILQYRNLTTSQPHNLTTSQPHNLTTFTKPHNLTTSQPHNLTTSQPHNLTTYNPRPHNPHNLTTSQPHNTVISQSYNPVISQSYNLTISQSCNPFLNQSHNPAILTVVPRL